MMLPQSLHLWSRNKSIFQRIDFFHSKIESWNDTLHLVNTAAAIMEDVYTVQLWMPV